jgi:hypothetical protein
MSGLASLRSAYDDFVACIRAVPEAEFLIPMNGWAPRDVVAHLIGWNHLMIQSSRSILAGEAPAYYADAPNDYRNINGAFVEVYSSRSKEELLRQLDSTMKDLELYLAGLPRYDLLADRDVRHYSGEPATVTRIIASLAGDYELHTRQVRGRAARR